MDKRMKNCKISLMRLMRELDNQEKKRSTRPIYRRKPGLMSLEDLEDEKEETQEK
jgi:predicted CopG family antitoxin